MNQMYGHAGPGGLPRRRLPKSLDLVCVVVLMLWGRVAMW